MNLVEDLVSPRTTTSDNDFINVNPSTSVEAQFQNSRVKNVARFDCKVIVKDIFEGEPTAKSNALKAHQDNNHSVFSRRCSDKDFLEQLAKKQPITWPKMSDEDSWCLLDSAVYSRLVGVSSIQEKVELLETTIYDQASRLFGHPVPSMNGSKGLNRRSRMSIKLCIEKNSLKNQINICDDRSEQQSLQALLKGVMEKLRNIRRGERYRKKRWKIKNANKSFFRNPYTAGKSILDPKCNIKLNVAKDTLDKHKASSVNDPLHNIPLPPLDDLPEPPSFLRDFNTSKFNFSHFMHIVNSRRNSSSPGINAIPYRVYKKCPQICSFLFSICNLCLKHSFVPVRVVGWLCSSIENLINKDLN